MMERASGLRLQTLNGQRQGISALHGIAIAGTAPLDASFTRLSPKGC